MLGADVGAQSGCAAELAEETVARSLVGSGVDGERRDDAGLKAFQRALGEGDAGGDGADDEARGVAFLKRGGFRRRNHRAHHQPRHYNNRPLPPLHLHL